jgi:hypothetical protein
MLTIYLYQFPKTEFAANAVVLVCIVTFDFRVFGNSF